MTDDQMITLLRQLDFDPGGSARFDIRTAVAEGRRRRRVRRVRAVSGAAAALAVAAVAVPVGLHAVRPPPGPPSVASPAPTATRTSSPSPAAPAPPRACTAELLPIPHGVQRSVVTGGDPTGRFLLGRSYPDKGEAHPIVIWDNGVPRDVRLPGVDQSLNDVNPAGVAVGSSFSGNQRAPYVYRNGTVSKLPGVRYGAAGAINEAGRIVGARDEGDRTFPVVWTSAEQPARDLPLPGPGWQGSASDIDDEGNIIGSLRKGPAGESVGYLWPAGGGVGRALPVPTLPGGRARLFGPNSIRNGWVTGVARLDSADGRGWSMHPVRLRLATGEFVPLGSDAGFPSVGNGQGWTAGVAGMVGGAMLTDAGMVPLPDLDGKVGGSFTEVRSISDDGRLLGGQVDDKSGRGGGQPRAVIWRCR